MVDSSDFSIQRLHLVQRLKRAGYLRSDAMERAMMKVPRELFVWPDRIRTSYEDVPLPLGKTGQTISAPHMVAILLEELELRAGIKVLEIGCGSGYNAALLAEVVSSEPAEKAVWSIERKMELVSFAKRNLERTGYADRIEVLHGDGTQGHPPGRSEEIYDRILVTAAASHIPQLLVAQLKKGGILLIPVGDKSGQDLLKVRKMEDGRLVRQKVCECLFVPLIESR